jgi:hypothetical protein
MMMMILIEPDELHRLVNIFFYFRRVHSYSNEKLRFNRVGRNAWIHFFSLFTLHIFIFIWVVSEWRREMMMLIIMKDCDLMKGKIRKRKEKKSCPHACLFVIGFSSITVGGAWVYNSIWISLMDHAKLMWFVLLYIFL